MAPESGSPEPVFNPQDLMDTFMGDGELIRSVVARFIERTGEQLQEFPVIQERKDWETARREAHLIKGSAKTISAQELGQLAARLETAYQYQVPQRAAEILLELEAAFARFKERVEPWLQGNGGG